MKGLHISVSPKEHHDLLVERIAQLKPTHPKYTEEERLQARKEKNKRFYKHRSISRNTQSITDRKYKHSLLK
jgi:hypothetical protein